jgi:hypothetical protein
VLGHSKSESAVGCESQDALIWLDHKQPVGQAPFPFWTCPSSRLLLGRREGVGIRQPHGSTRIRLPHAHASQRRPCISVAKREIGRPDDPSNAVAAHLFDITYCPVRNARIARYKSRLKRSAEAPRSGVLSTASSGTLRHPTLPTALSPSMEHWRERCRLPLALSLLLLHPSVFHMSNSLPRDAMIRACRSTFRRFRGPQVEYCAMWPDQPRNTSVELIPT